MSDEARASFVFMPTTCPGHAVANWERQSREAMYKAMKKLVRKVARRKNVKILREPKS